MKEFMAANGGLIGTVVLVMLAMNALLSGIKAMLEYFKDKTETTVDNKIYDFLSTVLGFLSKVLDIVGHNPAHKDPAAPVATEEKK